MKRINYYVAWLPEYHGYKTAMYNGYAESVDEFFALCEDADYDLTDLEIEEVHHNVKPNFGRLPAKGVNKDLGTL